MNASKWERLRRAFTTIVAKGPGYTSDELLRECAGDEELADQLQSLIDEHFELGGTHTVIPRPSRPAGSELPTVVAGRFRVIATLGSGSFGDVYRVMDEGGGGEQVALKILRSSDPLALHYFKREFRSLADIYHTNIAALYELIAYHDQWMFTMELVDGVDLLRFVKARPISERDAAVRSCIQQLAEGLTALHRRNLLHRDVKPANVLVTTAGRVVLLDFGLVRAFGDDVDSTLTFAGTPTTCRPNKLPVIW